MESPKITMYGRIISNADQTPLREYKEWRNNQIWHYGDINGIKGGESPYVIEFDIWNNEPAFNGLSGKQAVADAENCTLTVWDTIDCTSTLNINHNGVGFMNARCVTNDLNAEFQSISGVDDFKDIVGNVNSSKTGVLHGKLGGDHTVIQTKIIIPELNGAISPGDVNFVFQFGYEYV